MAQVNKSFSMVDKEICQKYPKMKGGKYHFSLFFWGGPILTTSWKLLTNNSLVDAHLIATT